MPVHNKIEKMSHSKNNSFLMSYADSSDLLIIKGCFMNDIKCSCVFYINIT